MYVLMIRTVSYIGTFGRGDPLGKAEVQLITRSLETRDLVQSISVLFAVDLVLQSPLCQTACITFAHALNAIYGHLMRVSRRRLKGHFS